MTVHSLEPGRDEMLAMGRAVLDELVSFVERLPDAPSGAVDGLEDLFFSHRVRSRASSVTC